jgi:hypothetical protein
MINFLLFLLSIFLSSISMFLGGFFYGWELASKEYQKIPDKVKK